MATDAERRVQARERQRRYRARKRAERASEAAPVSTDVDTAGAVVVGVRAELGRYSGAQVPPALAAVALRLAEILDDPTATPQGPSAARALNDLLGELRAAAGAGATSKLAQLRALRAVGQ